MKSLKRQPRIVTLHVNCWRRRTDYEAGIGWLVPGDIFVMIRKEDGWLYGLTRFGVVYIFDSVDAFHK